MALALALALGACSSSPEDGTSPADSGVTASDSVADAEPSTTAAPVPEDSVADAEPSTTVAPLLSEYPAEWDVQFDSAGPVPSDYEFGRATIDYAEGSVFPPNERQLPCAVTVERDVPVELRDGVTIYTDVLLPTGNDEELPAIVSWSPYGKTLPAGLTRSVPADRTSGIMKFEGPDAAFWVCEGYALIHPDTRGVFRSEGNGYAFGSVESADGHDLIEWAAEQPWSNGRIGLSGASWLAASQWGIAATQPPHLAAIAPWNGTSDAHRDVLFQGGIPDLLFSSGLAAGLSSDALIEDIVTMMERDPFRNDYWADKQADFDNVTVPAYVVADGATTLHNMGTFDGWRRIASPEKWLRVNNTNEWYDMYEPEHEEDLKRFFDRYLLDEDNGWEDTARVRVAVMDPAVDGNQDERGVEFEDFPVPDTEYRKLYLDGTTNTLGESVPAASTSTYDATTGMTTFEITFDEDVQLVGYLKARLYMEADGADDMDVFVLVDKLDSDGTPLVPSQIALDYGVLPPPGSPGRLRASMRTLDDELATDFNPVYSLEQPGDEMKVDPGEVVALDIALLPMEMRWHEGQTLRFSVAGKFIGDDPIANALQTVNAGTHVIHSGGDQASYLQIPVVPWTK